MGFLRVSCVFPRVSCRFVFLRLSKSENGWLFPFNPPRGDFDDGRILRLVGASGVLGVLEGDCNFGCLASGGVCAGVWRDGNFWALEVNHLGLVFGGCGFGVLELVYNSGFGFRSVQRLGSGGAYPGRGW